MNKGFGVAVTATPPNATDVWCTAVLKNAVRTLPPRQTGIAKAKPSTWPHHFHLLRTKDGIPAEDINRVVVWYAANIHDEFIPQAYSGESFRKKFPALERAMGKDKIAAVTEITPAARRVAVRLLMLGWPGEARLAVPGAAQACLTAYSAWRVRCLRFVGTINWLDGGESLRLYAFGDHLRRVLPPGEHFVEGWLREVNGRCAGWAGWDGDLNRHIWKPTAKRFTAIGRGWAVAYCGNPLRWDGFVAQMDREIPE